MLRKLKNILWYVGVDRISYERIKPRIQKVNLTMTTIISTFATLLIAAMFISSFKFGAKQNCIYYWLNFVVSNSALLFNHC